MFLSGLLLSRSLAKPRSAYYLGKINMIFWPYLIWCLIYLLVGGSGLAIGNPMSWIATGYLWYIFFLGCYYFLAPLLLRVSSHWIALIALIASLPFSEGLVKYFLYFAAFFFAGHAASVHTAYHSILLTKKWVIPLAVIAVGFGVFSILSNYRWEGQYALFCCAGIISVIYLAKKCAGARVLRPLRFVGENSMIFYTSHFPVLVLLIGFFSRFEGFPGWAATAAGVVAVAAVGLSCISLRKAPPVSLLFVGPLSFGLLRRT